MADCVSTREEFLIDARPEHGNPLRLRVVIIVKKAPPSDLVPAHRQIIARRPQHLDRHRTILEFGGDGVFESRNSRSNQVHLADGKIIAFRQCRYDPANLFSCCAVPHLHRPHDQQIRAEIRGLSQNLSLRSGAEGTDNHHRAHTHGNACQCQHRAHLVGKQSPRGNPKTPNQFHRSASIGDIRAARCAGSSPAVKPTRSDAVIPTNAPPQGATSPRCSLVAPMRASAYPSTIPPSPPRSVVAAVSTRNCKRMSSVLAPTARRKPISLARSFTEATIRLADTMPPTISEIAATRGK